MKWCKYAVTFVLSILPNETPGTAYVHTCPDTMRRGIAARQLSCLRLLSVPGSVHLEYLEQVQLMRACIMADTLRTRRRW